MTSVVETETTRTVVVENTVTGVVEVTAAGPAGAQGPAGLGLPEGGTTGQVLVKKSNTNYDTEWSTSTGLGTVTSVGFTAPTGFSISGSPITTSGTIALSFASGYSLPTTAKQTNWDTAYSWGNHALAGYAMAGANSDITSLSGITGSISTVDSIQFDTAAAATGAVGKLLWNDTDGTLEFQLKGGNVTLQVGQEQVLRVTNQSGSTMVDGQVVYITGSTGNHVTVTLAQANSEATSSKTIAVVTETIANNNSGFATTSGLVRGLNTSALTEGAAIWLSPTVPGGLTTTKPQAPDHAVLIGWCVKQHATVGVIYVHIANGYEVDELHDVKITGTPAAGSLLIRNATAALWENATLTAGTGVSITNADKSITITNSAPDQVVSLTAGTNVTITGTYPNFTIAASGGGGGSGTVTSVGLSVPTGFSVSGSPVTTSGTLALSFASGYSLPTTSSQTNWDTAYTDRLKWDGGSTGLVAATGRTSLGATTLGGNLFTITNPSAVTFPRFNADNTVSALDAATFRTAIGAGTGDGTVTSVGITAGTGISVSGGPITSSGSITVTNSAPMTYPGAGIAISTGSAWGTSLTAPSGAVVGTTDTQTLTNKRVTPRVNAQTTTSSPWAWNSDSYDQQSFSALANALTINADAGTPTDGQKAMFRFKDNGTARALTWTTGTTNSFRAIGVTLPTTTVANKTTYVGCVYNAADSRWDAVAVTTEV